LPLFENWFSVLTCENLHNLIFSKNQDLFKLFLKEMSSENFLKEDKDKETQAMRLYFLRR